MQRAGLKNWARFLPDVIHSYNHSLHRSIGMAPVEVMGDNVAKVWFKLKHDGMKRQPKIKPYEYNINDGVKIHYTRQPFRKEYHETSGQRIYFISDHFAPGQNHLYSLKTDKNELVPGRFSAKQVERVKITDQMEYRIESVVGHKRVNRVNYVQDKWLDYDPKIKDLGFSPCIFLL